MIFSWGTPSLASLVGDQAPPSLVLQSPLSSAMLIYSCLPGFPLIAGIAKHSTPTVPRDINPVFRCTFTMSMLRCGDVLRFTMRDTGLFANEHLGGKLGPRTVATATLKVGDSFEGYLEMVVPAQPIPGVGEPVLKVKALFPQYDGNLARPPVGQTAALSEVFNSRVNQQAMQMTSMSLLPAAPPPEELPASMTQPLALARLAAAPLAEESSSSELPATVTQPLALAPLQSPAPAAAPLAKLQATMTRQAEDTEPAVLGPEVPNSTEPAGPDVGVSGRPAGSSSDRCVGDVGALGSTNTSSPFFIDAFCQPPANLLFTYLEKLQDRNSKGVFLPSGAFRNYNCWAIGYQQPLGDWDENHMWGPIPDEKMPPLLDEVLKCMQKLWEEKNSPSWHWGVGMLVKLLENLKARCLENLRGSKCSALL